MSVVRQNGFWGAPDFLSHLKPCSCNYLPPSLALYSHVPSSNRPGVTGQYNQLHIRSVPSADTQLWKNWENQCFYQRLFTSISSLRLICSLSIYWWRERGQMLQDREWNHQFLSALMLIKKEIFVICFSPLLNNLIYYSLFHDVTFL